MALFITSLNSGSNGNCYYIGNAQEAVLVDAGISCRETEMRLKRLGLTMDKVKAIFISHEHSDHISGVPVLAKKYNLPVYITPKTRRNIRLEWDQVQIKTFDPYGPVAVGSLTITGFPKFHDAADPHSFVVTCDDVTVGIFTDIGSPCTHLVHHFRQCHAVILENKYDEDLLERGHYPLQLKKRIRGDKGHLSNRQALELFKTHADETKVVIASRYNETPVFEILPPAGTPARKGPDPGAGVCIKGQYTLVF
jgi:phosphoribosyl 1,2-cyclic phosphodiesterase